MARAASPESGCTQQLPQQLLTPQEDAPSRESHCGKGGTRKEAGICLRRLGTYRQGNCHRVAPKSGPPI